MNTQSALRFQATLAVLSAALVAAAASTARADATDDLIAKSLNAQGGREALLGVKSVERKGEVSVDGTFGQMEGSLEEVVIPWKKARRALDLAVFVQKDGFNGKIAWRDGMMGVQEIDGEEASQIKNAVDLNPFVMIAQRETKADKLDDETVDEVSYNVIQLTNKDRPAVRVYLDKESGQIARMSLTQNHPQFGKIEIVIENSDYQQFGPIKLATKNKVTLGELLQIETKFTDTRINGEVDEKIFEKPEEAAK